MITPSLPPKAPKLSSLPTYSSNYPPTHSWYLASLKTLDEIHDEGPWHCAHLWLRFRPPFLSRSLNMTSGRFSRAREHRLHSVPFWVWLLLLPQRLQKAWVIREQLLTFSLSPQRVFRDSLPRHHGQGHASQPSLPSFLPSFIPSFLPSFIFSFLHLFCHLCRDIHGEIPCI